MNYKTLMLLAALLMHFDQSIAQSNAPKFRVVGYVRESAVASDEAFNIDMNKITHLNVAFINPDSNGNIKSLTNLNLLIARAHQHNVKVLISIGGGLAPAYYARLLSGKYRTQLVNELLKYIAVNHIDGLDVDLEGERVDANYEAFITELSTGLKAKGKMLTAAVATVYNTRYSDKALACMDYINIMSYDKTGPWKPDNPGPHAPYEMAMADLDYWIIERGIDKNKVNLGLPFYGYGFGTNAPEDISYNILTTKYPGVENNDQVTNTGGGTIYYNGTQTMKRKTELALKRAGGIMIWQLLQDAAGDNSLLSLIDKTIRTYHP